LGWIPCSLECAEPPLNLKASQLTIYSTRGGRDHIFSEGEGEGIWGHTTVGTPSVSGGGEEIGHLGLARPGRRTGAVATVHGCPRR
jgi:hypothetical protein